MRKFFTYIIIVLLLSALIVCGVLFKNDIGTMLLGDEKQSGIGHTTIGSYISTEEVFENKLKQTTNILRATYIGKSVKMGAVFLEFKPVEQIFGDLGEENFWILIGSETNIVEGTTDELFLYNMGVYDYPYDSYQVSFTENTDYLIVAQKYVSVYFPNTVYKPTINGAFSTDNLREKVGNIIDSLRRQGCFKDDPEAIMNVLWESWDKEYLKDFMDYFQFWLYEETPESFTEADVYKTFPEYILSFVKSNPEWKEYGGAEYIQSDDFEYIKSQSEIVARIKVNTLEEGDLPSTAECSVKKVIKGEIENEEIRIDFIPETVKVGREYIVCLRSDYPFEITAKNAVQPVYSVWFYVGIALVAVLAVTATVIITVLIRRRSKKE